MHSVSTTANPLKTNPILVSATSDAARLRSAPGRPAASVERARAGTRRAREDEAPMRKSVMVSVTRERCTSVRPVDWVRFSAWLGDGDG